MFSSRLAKLTFWCGFLLLALWTVENFVGERFGWSALLLYLPQHGWGLAPLGLLMAALWQRRIGLALLNIAFLGFWAILLLGFGFPIPLEKTKNTKTLRLMTYNIERGRHGINALERAIRVQKPDIVCLQESQGVIHCHAYAPGAELAARFRGWSMAKSGDVMTLSRFPIQSQREFPLRGTRRILDTTLRTPRGPLRVLNLHVSTSYPPQPNPPQGKIGHILRVARDAKPAARTRLEQIAPIRHALNSGDSRLPVLMAGDFNSPPRGLFFRAISRDLTSAWQSGGRGLASTFPSRFPLLPIDHILVRKVEVRRAFVPDVGASDHRPMVVDFSLSN